MVYNWFTGVTLVSCINSGIINKQFTQSIPQIGMVIINMSINKHGYSQLIIVSV